MGMEILSTGSPSDSSAGVPCKIEMVFRFWSPTTKSTDSGGGAQAFALKPGVLALIEDLVAAKRGTFLAGNDQLYVSGLKHPADALIVSRQLQLGLRGFRSKNGEEPVGISIAIDSREESALSGSVENQAELGAGVSIVADSESQPSHDLVGLLKLSKPAQILVTHDLCARMGTFKGLPLRSFPGRFGVSEYLWTSKEKLDLLQSEPQLTLVTVPVLPQNTPNAQEPENPVGGIYAKDEMSFATRKVPEGEEGIQHWQSALRNPKWIAVGAAAVIVVVAGLLGISGAFRQSTKTTTPAKVMNEHPVTNPASTAKVAPPQVHAVRAQDAGRNNAAAKSAKTIGDSVTNAKIAKSPQITDQDRRVCLLDGNLSQVLALAENKRENAQYKGAERLFQQVLDCDPSNVEARQKLERTRAAEEQVQ
jgi:hypothetical protein